MNLTGGFRAVMANTGSVLRTEAVRGQGFAVAGVDPFPTPCSKVGACSVEDGLQVGMPEAA